MLDLSIISVTFNSRDQILAAIRSASAAAAEVSFSHEVMVVDNASTDGTAEVVESSLPQAILLRSARNIGFGAANNLARARGQRSLASAHPSCLIPWLRRQPTVLNVDGLEWHSRPL